MTISDHPHLLAGKKARDARRKRAARAAGRRALLAKAGAADRGRDILSSILNISSEGVVVLDEHLRILRFSKGAEAIFGYAPREVLGLPLERLIPPQSRSSHRGHVERFVAGAVQSRRMNARGEVLGLKKSGEVIPLEVGLSKLSTSGGLLFTALVRDVTERRQAEAALADAAARAEAANLTKSAFLATMSHEIRTPLNGVIGMAQAMGREELSPHQRERLEVIRRSGESLLAILNDLLDISKIEAGKLDLEDAEFDLDEVVGGAHATFAAIAEAKGLQFDLKVSQAARGIYRGDPLRVRQILHNLISNAVKFTERGRVTVSVSRSEKKLTFRVRDTGVGIAPEAAEQLFRKFEQADASTTRRFGGTGLGLAICRDLAEMMGGSLSVTSDHGQGAIFDFVVDLPRVARPAASRTRQQLNEGDWEPCDLRVLVAEDNGMNQLVLRTLLDQFEVSPVMVSNGREAVEAWAGAEWDLILMDAQMPEMDGPTATAMIRAREAAEGRRRTPIYALTANAMSHQALEYERVGMDGLIAKPIQLPELYAVLAKVADHASHEL